MKVLLINSNLLKPPITPLGLVYVATATREAGHEVALIDLNFSENIENDLKKSIADFNPDVIGISMRNIDNVTMLHSLYFIPTVKEIVGYCKKYSSSHIVMGGPGFSMMPEEIIKELEVPFGIIGEGEISFPQLLSSIDQDIEATEIKGVIYYNNGNIVKSRIGNMTAKQLNESSLPARELLDNDRYLKRGRDGEYSDKKGM